jgi:hypothetical protein
MIEISGILLKLLIGVQELAINDFRSSAVRRREAGPVS